MNTILFYLGELLTLIWGVSHLFPTSSIVKNFGDISQDNKKIITMEWVIEGVSLIFIGGLTIVITYINPFSEISRFVYSFTITMLLILAIVSLFTGFKVNFLPFRQF